MSWEKYIQFYCNSCGCLFDNGDTVMRLRKKAKKEGWIYNRKYKMDLCPDCKEDAI